MGDITGLITAIIGAGTALAALAAGVWKLYGEVRKQRKLDHDELVKEIREELQRDYQLDQAKSTIEAKNRELEAKERLIVSQAAAIARLERRIEQLMASRTAGEAPA